MNLNLDLNTIIRNELSANHVVDPNTRLTLLHLAILQNNQVVTRYLLERGANVYSMDVWGNEPADYLIPGKQVECERLLSLHARIREGHMSVIRIQSELIPIQ